MHDGHDKAGDRFHIGSVVFEGSVRGDGFGKDRGDGAVTPGYLRRLVQVLHLRRSNEWCGDGLSD